MKNTQHRSATDALEKKFKVSSHHSRVPKPKPASGSVIGLYPVILDDGKTIIYTSDKSKEGEIRSKYALRK